MSSERVTPVTLVLQCVTLGDGAPLESYWSRFLGSNFRSSTSMLKIYGKNRTNVQYHSAEFKFCGVMWYIDL